MGHNSSFHLSIISYYFLQVLAHTGLTCACNLCDSTLQMPTTCPAMLQSRDRKQVNLHPPGIVRQFIWDWVISAGSLDWQDLEHERGI
jgi:hypothetical protein